MQSERSCHAEGRGRSAQPPLASAQRGVAGAGDQVRIRHADDGGDVVVVLYCAEGSMGSTPLFR